MSLASQIALMVCPNASRTECHAAAAMAAAINARTEFSCRAVLAVEKASRFRSELEAWSFNNDVEFRPLSWQAIVGRHLQQAYGLSVPRHAIFALAQDGAFDFRDCQFGILFGAPPGVIAPTIRFAQYWVYSADNLRGLPIAALAANASILKSASEIIIGDADQAERLRDYLRLNREKTQVIELKNTIEPITPPLDFATDFAVVCPDVQSGIQIKRIADRIMLSEQNDNRTLQLATEAVNEQFDTLLPDIEWDKKHDTSSEKPEPETSKPVELPAEVIRTDCLLNKGQGFRNPLQTKIGLGELSGFVAQARCVVTGPIVDPNDYRIQLCRTYGTPLIMLWEADMGMRPAWVAPPLYTFKVASQNELWTRTFSDFISVVKRSPAAESASEVNFSTGIDRMLQRLVGGTIGRSA